MDPIGLAIKREDVLQDIAMERYIDYFVGHFANAVRGKERE